MSYDILLSKGKIGKLVIKNRSVMSPMGTDFANHDGTVSERTLRYYEERAKGGIGLIVTEYTGVDDINSVPSNHNLRMARDYHISGAERLAEAVHKYDCKIFAQLHHGGSTSKLALSGRQPLSASAVPFVKGAPPPREMTIMEIQETEQKFIDAAVRCKKAGFDGVELHGAHSYLLAQFFSKYYNRRTDEYGGNVENRCRIIGEIIAGIRKACGPNFPITARICGDEMTPVEGFLTLQDGLEIGKYLEKAGIDAINISNGSSLNGNANCDPYSYTPGWKKHVAKAFREALSIPVIATNTIKNPEFAEELLQEGICDFVALGRSQFSDPDFMRKAKENKAEEIRQCIGCMYCRERLLGNGLTAACAINPRMGCEFQYSKLEKNGCGQPVTVIGGGPGGMEAARVLAERNFAVTLFEKEDRLGGTMHIACLPNFKGQVEKLVRTMETQITRLGVDIKLNTEATTELVKQLQPVGVFVASGAVPIIPPLPGINKPNVYTAEDVVAGKAAPTGKVAVIGSGMTGLETAEMLGDRGASVMLVEMQDTAGPGIYNVILNDIMGRIKKQNTQILTGHKLLEVTESGVRLAKTGAEEMVDLECDHVVLALGVCPRTDIVEGYEKLFDKVSVVGDAGRTGRIAEAMKEGYAKAYAFE